jgi:nucleoid-associated protein EbfC
MFGKNGMADLMKQAKKMQEELEKSQQELANLVVEGAAGGGLVKVKINGKHEVLSIEMDAGLKEESLEIISDLTAAAFNDAVRKLAQASESRMSNIQSMMPAGMKLPF